MANTCSRISFVPGPTGELGNSTLRIRNGAIPNQGAARSEETVYYGNEIIEGTIIFNPDLVINGFQFYDPQVGGYDTIYIKNMMHEIGHLLGMNHYTANYNACTQQSHQSSVMNDSCGVNDNGTYINGIFYPSNQTTTVMHCDYSQLIPIYPCPATPTPTPTPICATCNDSVSPTFNGTCPPGYDSNCMGMCCPNYGGTYPNCQDPPPVYSCNTFQPSQPANSCPYTIDTLACSSSPVLIDINGNGFSMTNDSNGVAFDINGDGVKEQLSWTSVNSDDAWLAFDRNNNALIDSGKELFGNFTAQTSPPAGEERNGFLALALLDRFSKGGNEDGVIDAADNIFSSLLLWQDLNHNGISEANELHSLPELGITGLDLDYKESKRTDEFGNQFKYRAKVWDAHRTKAGRWAWDVFLVKGN